MPIYFLDTSALQYRYVPGNFSRRIRRLVSDGRSPCYIADVTVLEISSALGTQCRKRGWVVKKFDTMDSSFLADVASGRLKVCTTTKRDVLKARDLIRFAGVVKQKSLKSADALIAVCCLELALEKKQKIIFYLEDRKLYSTLRVIGAYRSALKLRHLGSS